VGSSYLKWTRVTQVDRVGTQFRRAVGRRKGATPGRPAPPPRKAWDPELSGSGPGQWAARSSRGPRWPKWTGGVRSSFARRRGKRGSIAGIKVRGNEEALRSRRARLPSVLVPGVTRRCPGENPGESSTGPGWPRWTRWGRSSAARTTPDSGASLASTRGTANSLCLSRRTGLPLLWSQACPGEAQWKTPARARPVPGDPGGPGGDAVPSTWPNRQGDGALGARIMEQDGLARQGSPAGGGCRSTPRRH
jgi:hypothetical protein